LFGAALSRRSGATGSFTGFELAQAAGVQCQPAARAHARVQRGKPNDAMAPVSDDCRPQYAFRIAARTLMPRLGSAAFAGRTT